MALTIGDMVAKLELDASNFNRGMKSAASAMDDTKHSATGLGSTMATGLSFAVATAAVDLFLKGISAAKDAVVGMVGVAADFEQSISAIGAVSNATADEMKQLSDHALQLGKDTSFSALESAKAMEELVKGGLTIPDILGGAAKATLDLAAAGGVAVADAAEIAANAMAMFNLKGGDMENVANKIAGAANASSLSVTDFKFSLAMVGAVAATAGQSFDETATAIAVLGQQGLKGSDAGTSLKQMMLQLIPTTDRQTAAMRELGVITADGTNRFIDEHGAIKPLSEIAGILAEGTADMTESQKLLNLELAFGSDAMRAAAIMSNQGAEGFAAMAAAMGKVTAEAVAMERLNNLRGDLEKLSGSWETFQILLGSMVLPALRSVTQALTEMVNAGIEGLTTFNNRIDALQKVEGLNRLDATLQAISMSLKDAFGPNTALLFDRITQKVGEFFAAIKGAGGGENPLEVFARGVERASGLIMTAFDVIGPAVEGIQRVIGGFITAFTADTTTLSGTVDTFVRLLNAGFSVDAAAGILEFADSVEQALSGLGAILTTHIGMWRAFGEDLVGVFAELAEGDLQGAFDKMGDAVIRLMDTMRDNILTNVPLIGEAFGELGMMAVKWIADAAPKVLDGLLDLYGRIIDWILENAPGIAEAFANWAMATLEWAREAAVELLKSLGEMIEQVCAYIVENAPRIAAAIAEWVPGMVAWVLGTALPGVLGALMSLVGTVVEWLVSGGAEAIWEAGVAVASALVNAMGGIITGLYGNLVAWITDVFDKFKVTAGGLAQAAGREVADKIAAGVEAGITAAKAKAEEAGRAIVRAVGAGADAEGQGKSPYEKFAHLVGEIGIAGGIGLGIQRGTKTAQTAIAGFMNVLIENSSNATAAFGKVGGDLAEALFRGIADDSPEAGAKVARSLETMVTKLQTSGIPQWRELGDALAESLHNALIEKTPEAQQAALQLISEAAEVLAEANSPTGIWRARIHDLAQLGALTEELGKEGARAGQAFIDALSDPTKKNIDALGKNVEALVARAAEKGIPAAAELGRRLDELIGEALANIGNPERLAEIDEEFRAIVSHMSHGLDDLKNKVKTPIEAAMEAATDAIRDSKLVEQFGIEGAKAMGAWADALGDPRVATQVVNGMQKVTQAAVKAGVEGAAETGQRMQEAFLNYLRTHDEGYREEGEALARQLWAGTQAVDAAAEAAKLADKMENALASSMDRVSKALTGKMSFHSAITVAFNEMGAATDAAIAKWEPDTVKNLTDAVLAVAKVASDVWKDKPAERDAFMTELFAAWNRVMAEQSPEAIANLNAVIGGFRGALVAGADELGNVAKFSMEQIVAQFADARWAQAVGKSFAGLFENAEQHIQEGTTKSKEALDKGLVNMLLELQKMGPKGKTAMKELFALMQQAQDEGWPATIDNLEAWVTKWGLKLGDGVRGALQGAQQYADDHPIQPGFNSNFGAGSTTPPGGQTPPGTGNTNQPSPGGTAPLPGGSSGGPSGTPGVPSPPNQPDPHWHQHPMTITNSYGEQVPSGGMSPSHQHGATAGLHNHPPNYGYAQAATGGRVDRPTLLLVGEAGTEWVIPQDKKSDAAFLQRIGFLGPPDARYASAMSAPLDAMVPPAMTTAWTAGGGHGPGAINSPNEELHERHLAHLIAEEMATALVGANIVAKLDPSAVHQEMFRAAQAGTAPFVVSRT